MSTALLVMTDGRRDCISRTLASVEENVMGVEWTRKVIHDDSGSADYRAWLREVYPSFELLHSPTKRGFGGSIRAAWEHLLADDTLDYVWHQEDDFTYNRPINLHVLALALESNPYLAQLALRRQAWSGAEIAAGGVIEQHPEAYHYHANTLGWRWLEHRLFFTTNPSLYRAALMRAGWPYGDRSEGVFTHRLLERGVPWGVPGDLVRFAYWGHRDDSPWVHHIGDQRAGNGY